MGFLLAIIFLIVNLLTNSHYGYTWDLPHHFNAGLRHLGLPPKDPQFGTQPYGPISDTLPVISWFYLFKNWNLLPPDEAYHLPLILYGSIGILIVYLLAREMFGFYPAIFSATFLAFYPRYIGHIHNNMKDPPSAVTIALAIYLFIKFCGKAGKIFLSGQKQFLRPTSAKQTFLLLAAAFAAGLAFNTKVNAILIPPIVLSWLLLSYRDQIKLRFPKIWTSSIGPTSFYLLLVYLLLVTFFSLLIWWPFWQNPIFTLKDMIRHFSTGTTGFRLFYYGKYYLANINIPWHYALGYLAAVTPTPILILAIIGFTKAVYNTITLKNRYSGLLLTWFLIPTLKYAYPKVGILDDIRHFLEVLFPLMIFAGLGATEIFKATRQHVDTLTRRFRINVLRANVLRITCYVLLVTYLFFQIASVHPYETAYFSEWLGGLKGANNKFDLEFWGNALKEGSTWLNKNAPPHSVVSSPFAQQVAREYLRSDITVVQYPTPNTNFIMFFNRPSFIDTYQENASLRPLIASKTPLYVITRQATPLLWIFAYK